MTTIEIDRENAIDSTGNRLPKLIKNSQLVVIPLDRFIHV